MRVANLRNCFQVLQLGFIHLMRTVCMHKIVSFCEVHIFHHGFCFRANRDCWEWDLPHRCRFFSEAYNNWRILPLLIDLVNQDGTSYDGDQKRNYPENTLCPVTTTFPKIFHSMNCAVVREVSEKCPSSCGMESTFKFHEFHLFYWNQD